MQNDLTVNNDLTITYGKLDLNGYILNVQNELLIYGILQMEDPNDELYVYKDSKLEDNRVRQTLLGDYTPESDERVIVETTVANPITLASAYTRR